MDMNFVSEIAFYKSTNQKSDLAKDTSDDSGIKKMDSFSTVTNEVKEEKEINTKHPTTSNYTAVANEAKEENETNKEINSKSVERQTTSGVKIIKTFTNKENAHYSPKLLIDKNNKPFAALIVEQDNNVKSFTVFTLAEFIKIFGENEYSKLSKAIRLRKIAARFIKQCTYTDALENHDNCVYFNSEEAYVNFANVIISFL